MTHTPTHPTAPAVSPLQRLWLLRLLVPLGGQRQFVEASGYRCDRTAHALGLLPAGDTPPQRFDPADARATLARLHRRAEQGADRCAWPEPLQRNLQRLSGWVALGDLERRLLGFVVQLHNERLLDDAADWLGMLSSSKVHQALSVLLDAPVSAIRQALGPEGPLGRTGLVKVDHRGVGPLKAKLDLLSDSLADRIAMADVDPLQLLRDVVWPSPPAQLGLADYAHLQGQLPALIAYLRQALQRRQSGVNVLVYGPPGTGKSQLARVMAQTLGVALFEVASEDQDGEPTTGERRLRAYRAAQGILGTQPSLLLFDEVEDVFDDGYPIAGRRSTAQVRKAWLNHALESNPVPTVWVSNAIQAVDPAFLRRYDWVLALPVPPRSARWRHIQATGHRWLDPDTLDRVADAPDAAPALITRAAGVVAAIQGEALACSPAQVFEWIVNGTLRAQGHAAIPRASAAPISGVYDLAFIQADTDVRSLVQGLQSHGNAGAKLCLHGPPGTGKTAFGHWLARALDRPILVQRGADLLDPHLGHTERRIAQAFEQADAQRAVLLWDEVDGFLQDRQHAPHDWVLTRVNELLAQMETFQGVFVASTNRIERVDPAALRRFDLRVRFDFLAPDQVAGLLWRHCQQWGLGVPEAPARARAMRLANVTPGDFAGLARQHRWRPFPDASAVVRALAQACALKACTQRVPMGFIPAVGGA